MTVKKYFGNSAEPSTALPLRQYSSNNNVSTINPKLAEALQKLEKITVELQELVMNAGAIHAMYTIAYAKEFVKAKSCADGVKAPSDEVAKQMVLSSESMANIIQEYTNSKLQIDLYLEMSRNVRKQIDGLKGTLFEEAAVNNAY